MTQFTYQVQKKNKKSKHYEKKIHPVPLFYYFELHSQLLPSSTTEKLLFKEKLIVVNQSDHLADQENCIVFTIPKFLEYLKGFLVQEQQQFSILSDIQNLESHLLINEKFPSQLSVRFTCSDGKCGDLSDQAQEFYIHCSRQ